MSPRKVRVFLVDDHELVRSGLKALVEAQPDMSVVGEAAEGLAGIEAIAALLPDVVLMDLWMPVLGGAEATERIKAAAPEVQVLALTAREERAYLDLVMAAGASGYVLKRSAAEELVRAIRAVAGGGVHVDPSLTATARSPRRHCADSLGRSPLSEREAEVLRRLAEGYAVKDIAAALEISARTLETYRARAMTKLGLETRVDIVRYALSRGWLKSD